MSQQSILTNDLKPNQLNITSIVYPKIVDKKVSKTEPNNCTKKDKDKRKFISSSTLDYVTEDKKQYSIYNLKKFNEIKDFSEELKKDRLYKEKMTIIAAKSKINTNKLSFFGRPKAMFDVSKIEGLLVNSYKLKAIKIQRKLENKLKKQTIFEGMQKVKPSDKTKAEQINILLKTKGNTTKEDRNNFINMLLNDDLNFENIDICLEKDVDIDNYFKVIKNGLVAQQEEIEYGKFLKGDSFFQNTENYINYVKDCYLVPHIKNNLFIRYTEVNLLNNTKFFSCQNLVPLKIQKNFPFNRRAISLWKEIGENDLDKFIKIKQYDKESKKFKINKYELELFFSKKGPESNYFFVSENIKDFCFLIDKQSEEKLMHYTSKRKSIKTMKTIKTSNF